MKYLNALSIGLILAITHGATWAQIYETKDKKGNPVFSDEPVNSDSSVVDLTETNIADAPPPPPAAAETTLKPGADEVPQPGNEPVVIDGANPSKELGEQSERLQEDYDRREPNAPHEVLDAEPRHEVMDAEPRHVVEDAEPRHVIEDAEPRHVVEDAEPRHEVMDAEPRHEVGDF